MLRGKPQTQRRTDSAIGERIGGSEDEDDEWMPLAQKRKGSPLTRALYLGGIRWKRKDWIAQVGRNILFGDCMDGGERLD